MMLGLESWIPMYMTCLLYTSSVYSANALDVTERLEHGTLDFGLLFEPVNTERYQYLDLPYEDTVGLPVSYTHLNASASAAATLIAL